MHRIDLSPNASLTWQCALIVLGSIAAASLFIALIFLAQGYWTVLPFAGLELGLLGWAMWHSMRKSRQRDMVLLEDQRVVVEKYRLNRHERMEFPRYWTRVRLEPAVHRHHPTRLLIRARGRGCEIGDFLTDEERASLQARLTELLTANPPLVHGKDMTL